MGLTAKYEAWTAAVNDILRTASWLLRSALSEVTSKGGERGVVMVGQVEYDLTRRSTILPELRKWLLAEVAKAHIGQVVKNCSRSKRRAQPLHEGAH